MKQIVINDEIFFYKTEWYDNGEYGDSPVTIFWQEEKEVKYRKYLFFGPWRTKIEPVVLFSIYDDSNNSNLTKGYWKQKIEYQIELLGRSDELKKGELI